MTVILIIQHSAVVDREAEEFGGDELGQVLEPTFEAVKDLFICHFHA